jgi:thioredoxin 2
MEHPSESVIRRCPDCGSQNRIPVQRLASSGRCGRCGGGLAPFDEPIEPDLETFIRIVADCPVPALAASFDVRGIPNFVVLKDCRRVRQHAGMASARELQTWLEQAAGPER